MLPTTTELEAERLRRSFPAFVERGWHVVEPAPFVPGFHLDAICGHLEAVARGEIRRLLINVPPRHGKSLLVSVLWPAWVWASRPETRFLFASYAHSLSLRDSGRCRRLVESDWYRARWGGRVELVDDMRTKERFELTAGGARIATSVGGWATGEGGDVIVIDDPHKIEEASSPAAREATIEWFDGTMSTRQNDPRTSATVIVGQRLHERDLFGHLVAQGDLEHLCLPAEFERSHPFRWPHDPRRVEGDLLWPERFGAAELADLKRSLGSQQTASQLQQRPAPAEGAVFRREWWRWYPPEKAPVVVDRVLQSWDLTFGDGAGADYVVGQAWAAVGPDRYLLRQIRERLSFVDQIAAIEELTEWVNARYPRHRGHAIIGEEAANGTAMVSVLKRTLQSVVGERPRGIKLARASAVTPQVEAGNVFLPGAPNADGAGYDARVTPAWVQAFVHEAETFPSGAYDDQVDAMAQALSRLRRARAFASSLHPREAASARRATTSYAVR